MSLFSRITTFLKEVRTEVKKVNWPTRQETFNYTLLVLGISVALAIFLGGVDQIFKVFLNKFIL